MSDAPVAFRASWSRQEDEPPPRPVNQLMIQVGLPSAGLTNDGLIYLRLGHAEPPVLMGSTQEERAAEVQGYGGVLNVHSYGQFVLSRSRAREIVKIMQDFLDKTEEASQHD